MIVCKRSYNDSRRTPYISHAPVTSSTHGPAHGEDDHLVHSAGDLAAAIRVVDGHEVDIDHAGPFVVRPRLAHHAKAAQSIQSIMHDGGGVHVVGQNGARS